MSGLILDYLKSGLYSERPAAPTPSVGALSVHWAEDEEILSVWNAGDSTWVEVFLGGISLPNGGTAGQALLKVDSTDFNWAWTNVLKPSDIGAGAGQVAAGDDSRLLNNLRTTGGVQQVFNNGGVILNSMASTVIGVLAPVLTSQQLLLFKAGAASIQYIVASGNQAGLRCHAYGGLANNRFIRYGGTYAAPTNLTVNDVISDLNSYGLIGGTEAELGRIRTQSITADTSIATNNAARTLFYNGRDGSASVAPVLSTEYQLVTAYGVVAPNADNLRDLGTAGLRWKEIFCVNAVINTSDERLKTNIQSITDELLDAWAEVEWVAYQWEDSIEEKGPGARWHFGLIAQRVKDVLDSKFGEGKAVRMGLICYDSWGAQEQITTPVMADRQVEVQIRDAEGHIIIGQKQLVTESYDTGEVEIVQEAREAGDRWGLRYDECQAIENAYQRREIARLKAQIQGGIG